MKFISKGFFLILLSLTVTLSLKAQTTDNNVYDYVNPQTVNAHPEKTNFISFGFGVGGYYPYSGPIYTSTPSLSFNYDHVVLKHVGPGNITLGALFAFKQIATGYTDYNGVYTYYQVWNYFLLGSRMVYYLHPFNTKRIELYAGGTGGYFITGFMFKSNDPHFTESTDPGNYLSINHYPNYFSGSIFGGIRSWFSHNGCVWAELGCGYTTANVGFSYKI